MEEWKILELSIQAYDHLLLNKCLCTFQFLRQFQQVHCDMFQSSLTSDSDVDQRKKNHLLHISIMQTICEIYLDEALVKHSVCPEISNLLNLYLSDEMWDDFIQERLQFKEDKHLVWIYMKSFCSLLYCLPEPLFRSRVQMLLNVLEKNLFDESLLPVLEFLTHLVNHRRMFFIEGNVSQCKKPFACKIVSAEETFLCYSSLLSQSWDTFIEKFYCILCVPCKNKSVHQFLLLWKSLSDRCFGGDLNYCFLKNQHVLDFFTCAHNLPLLSCRLYVDIIIQIFYLSLKCKVHQKFESAALKKAVENVIENIFLDLLPYTSEVLGFCNLPSKKSNEDSLNEFRKCDSIIMQKVAFTLLNILTDMENECLLCKALKSVLIFLKKNSDISYDQPIYAWVLDIFINQDDILTGVMLALLRIYVTLKGKMFLKNMEHSSLEFQLHLINPHKIFINFLKRLGYDTNELLAFLTSDETCFLLYFTEYLKLLVKEPDNFIEAHNPSSVLDLKLNELCTEGVCLIDISHKCSSSCAKYSHSSLVSLNNKQLVSYSSSSSSDEEAADVSENVVGIETLNRNVSSSFMALLRLKNTIIKLVNLGEFPFKASPLISLLENCEQHFRNYDVLY